jgi:hypothetical protein
MSSEEQFMIEKELKGINDRRIEIKKKHYELSVKLRQDSNNQEIKNRIKALEEENDILKERDLELFYKM